MVSWAAVIVEVFDVVFRELMVTTGAVMVERTAFVASSVENTVDVAGLSVVVLPVFEVERMVV